MPSDLALAVQTASTNNEGVAIALSLAFLCLCAAIGWKIGAWIAARANRRMKW